VRRQCGEHRLFDIDAIERPLGERGHAAVDAHRRRRPCDQKEIAAVTFGQDVQPALEPRRRSRRDRHRRALGRGVELQDQAIDVVLGLHDQGV
jgi:hypothetical protein